MSTVFTGQRCSDCMGNLEYDKARKIWYCPYCGKEFERDLRVDKVQIDGVAGLNETVRATLFDISRFDFASALNNLAECEKINPNHVGTKIANICFYLFKATNAQTKDEVQKNLAKTTYYAKQLNSDYSEIYQDEVKLYDYLNNPDIYAILYISFNSIASTQRENLIYNYLQLDSVVEVKINKHLLTIFLKKKALEDVDKIIKKINFIDKKFSLNEILKKYPDGKLKIEYICKLMDSGAFKDVDAPLVINYINTTSDSVETKFALLSRAVKQHISIDLSKVLVDIFKNCTDEQTAKSIFEMLETLRLRKDEVEIVLEYCLSKECPNDEIAIVGLNYLKSSESLFQIEASNIIQFLEGNTYPNNQKITITKEILNIFTISSKSKDELSNYALINCSFEKSERLELIKTIFSHISSITLRTLEDYVVLVNKDEENKEEIIKMIFDLGMNQAYFNTLLSKYLLSSKDEAKIKASIVLFLLDKGLKCNSQEFSNLILASDLTDEQIDKFKKYNLKPDAATLMKYFNKITNLEKYNTSLVDYLLTFNIAIDAKTIQKYLLQTTDNQQRKRNIVNRMLASCTTMNFTKVLFSVLDDEIEGNLIQCYLLTSKDDQSIKLELINKLSKYMKLSDALLVNNDQIKFKKYILKNKENISKETDKLCEELGVYKLFF